VPREETAIVGGGNSAGQAAVYLAETAEKVYVIVRSEGLVASMSQYLIRRIETTPNIELVTGPRSSSSKASPPCGRFAGATARRTTTRSGTMHSPR
jgi:thioredoxin reductase (NADPH)